MPDMTLFLELIAKKDKFLQCIQHGNKFPDFSKLSAAYLSEKKFTRLSEKFIKPLEKKGMCI